MSSVIRSKALLQESARRNKFADAVDEAATRLFPQQRAIYESKAKRVLLKAGRRSGKTYTAQSVVTRAGSRNPGAVVPVCQRTLTCAAARTFWSALIAFDAEFKLGMEFRHTAKEAILPNNARIQMFGVDTLELADKLRGEPYPVVFIDECGTYRSHVLKYLVDDVLTPSMIDYDGAIYSGGTPGLVKKGTWYEMCHASAWEQHHWTLLDNPELGKKAYQRTLEWRREWLKDYILSKEWLPSSEWKDRAPEDVIAACKHPTFLREYLGQWVDSSGDQMYEFGPRNILSRLPAADPKRPWRYGLGIDLGYEDPTAFVVSATRPNDPLIYGVMSYAESKLIPSTIAAHIDRLKTQFGRFSFVVGDTGGAGKLAVEEMNQKYGTNILPAQKTGKRVFVEHVNGEMRSGRIVLVESGNQALIEDLYNLPWNEDKTDAAENHADHIPDALLYSARQWLNTRVGWGEREAARPGSEEWLRLQREEEEAFIERLVLADARAERYAAGEDPDFGDEEEW